MTDDLQVLKDGYPTIVEIPVQWGDQDSFGHVNNVIFFRWMETARIQFLSQQGMTISHEGTGPILAALNCNFVRQVRFPDTILTCAKLEKLGKTSITIEHVIVSDNQQAIVATGSSVIVNFDYQAQRPAALDESLRQKLSREA